MNLERFPFRTMQFAIALAVGSGAIYFSETNDYPINPMIIGAWSFMAAYGATLGIVRLADWQSRRIDVARRGEQSANVTSLLKRLKVLR